VSRKGTSSTWRKGALPAALVLAAAGSAMASRIGVNDTGHLHLLKAFGSVLFEEGYVGGTLPGQTKVRLVVQSSVSATFSIAAHGGTIYGGGRAALHSSGRYSSFGGSLWVSGGSGRYRHARGGGRLYGTIDRRTHAVIVQTIGRLTY
jgi:hypothetical protein